MSESITSGVVLHATRRRHEITYTPAAGPVAGVTLVSGRVASDHPKAGQCVVFTSLDNRAACARLKVHTIAMRTADKPDLSALADECQRLNAVLDAAEQAKEAEYRGRFDAALADYGRQLVAAYQRYPDTGARSRAATYRTKGGE